LLRSCRRWRFPDWYRRSAAPHDNRLFLPHLPHWLPPPTLPHSLHVPAASCRLNHQRHRHSASWWPCAHPLSRTARSSPTSGNRTPTDSEPCRPTAEPYRCPVLPTVLFHFQRELSGRSLPAPLLSLWSLSGSKSLSASM